MTLEEIKRKAMGLKNMAERGGTPEECAVAAGLLQNLLTKHKLDISQLKVDEEEEIGYSTFYVGGDRMTLSWRRLLANIVAEHTFCLSAYVKGTKTVDFIGKRADIEICQYLTDYLLSEVERLFREYRKKNPKSFEAEKAPFGMGAVHAIGETLASMWKDEQRKNEAVRSLVRRENYRLKKLEESLGSISKKTNFGPSFKNPAAFMEGMEAGSSVKIRKAVNDEGRKGKIG